MLYTKTINDNMIINFDYAYHHLLSRINVLNNQREITLILKRDKRKSISVEVNKKHFKELTKYKMHYHQFAILSLLNYNLYYNKITKYTI